MKPSILYKIVRLIAMPVLKILYRYEIKGADSLPRSGRVIVCCNHMSLMDCVLVVIAQKRQVRFMAKKELFDNRLLGWILHKVGAFPVERGKGDTTAISVAESILNSEEVLGIFIEGTRSKDGNLLRPKSGAAMIALHTDSPVLPMCITCPDGGRIAPFKKVIVSCGDIISVDELKSESDSKAKVRSATRLIMDRIKDMREKDLKK